jgi:hypothetical protein
VAGGFPMHLVATGTEKWKSIVLILCDSSQMSSHPVSTWTPKGLCKK